MHGKLKTGKERIETNFPGQDVPYEMYCNATAASLRYHLQVYAEKCKYIDAESQQCNILIDSNDKGFFQASKVT